MKCVISLAMENKKSIGPWSGVLLEVAGRHEVDYAWRTQNQGGERGEIATLIVMRLSDAFVA